MSSFKIVLTALENGDPTGPEMKIIITDDQIREVNIRANGVGLTGMPAIDWRALVAALAGSQRPVLPAGSTTATPARAKPAAATVAPPAKRTSAKVEPEPVKAPKTSATTPKKRVAKAAPPAAPAAPTEGRAYRKAPDPADLIQAYRQTGGGIPALMDHFDVPRHTISGWLRQLRKNEELAAQLKLPVVAPEPVDA